MKYNKMVDRIRKVVYSCTCDKQLFMASKYCSRVLRSWNALETKKDDSFTPHFDLLRMYEWKETLIEKQRLKL